MMENHQPKDKSDLLDAIQTEREILESLMAGLSESQIVDIGVEASWSIKDILAHIAAWERVAIDIIQAARDGEALKSYIPKIFKSIDDFNATIYDTHKDDPSADVMAEFKASHNDFLSIISSLSEDFISSNLPFEGTEELTIQYMISANTHWHYKEHSESIQNWLASRPS